VGRALEYSDALTPPQCAHHKAPHTRACPSSRLAQPRARPSSAPRISNHIVLHTNPHTTHNPRNTHRPQHTNRSTSQSFVVCPCIVGLLSHPDSDVRRTAVEALGTLGHAALASYTGAIAGLLTVPVSDARSTAVELLALACGAIVDGRSPGNFTR